jgi:hypothetical protein
METVSMSYEELDRVSVIERVIERRLDEIADGASLTHNRAPGPHQWADVVADLRAAREGR